MILPSFEGYLFRRSKERSSVNSKLRLTTMPRRFSTPQHAAHINGVFYCGSNQLAFNHGHRPCVGRTLGALQGTDLIFLERSSGFNISRNEIFISPQSLLCRRASLSAGWYCIDWLPSIRVMEQSVKTVNKRACTCRGHGLDTMLYSLAGEFWCKNEKSWNG